MFLAVTEFDPVIGIDIHIVMIPTPGGPVPTPLPHPFIGVILNPLDWIPFFNNIRVNHMPAAGVASNAMNAPPGHIPQGGPWMKGTVGNEALIMLGSHNTSGGGKLMAVGPMIVLSCSCVGMPPQIKMSNEMAAAVTYLPTSNVLPIPKGSPVIIGGIPVPDLKALALAFAMKIGMTWLKGKLRGWQKTSEFWENLSNRLNQYADNIFGEDGWMRNLARRAICAVTGHPVDIATGKVFTDIVDFEIAGPVPFVWERVWYSTSCYEGPLGHGWHHSYDLSLQDHSEAKCLLIRMDDGRYISFPRLQPGQTAYNRQEQMQLRREDGEYVMRSSENLHYRFKAPLNRDHTVYPLLSVENDAGFALRFAYDRKGCLSGITDSAGRFFEVASDPQGRILSIRSPHPEREGETIELVSYRYDLLGNLVEARNALGQPFAYRYQKHLLVQETNRNGLSFYFEYDGEDHHAWCTRTWGDGGIYNHKLTYNREEKWTIVENSLGQKTKYFWNNDGLVFKTIDPLGHERVTRYGEFLQKTAEIDELGQVTAYEYDVWGNQTGIVRPDGSSIKKQYEETRLVAATDPNGGKWAWQYNEQGQLTARSNPLGEKTRYAYANGALQSMTAPNGGETTLAFDAQHNLSALRLPDGTTSRWTYDRLGRSTTHTDAKGNTQTRSFDLLGRAVRVQEPDGNLRHLAYDGENNVVHARDNHHDVLFEYGGMNRMKTRIEGGTRVEFSYNTEEDLIGILNEHGYAYRFGFNQRGEVETESGFDGLTRRYVRDAAGRVVEVKRPDGKSSRYQSDTLGQVTRVEHADGSWEQYAYRADGGLLEAANAHIALRFERDALGRVTKETQGGFVVTSAYNNVGQRTAVRSSLGAHIQFTRNLMGDVEHVSADGGDRPWEAAFQRDNVGLELERSLPGGVRSRWERDRLGRPVKQEMFAGGSNKSNRTRAYSWDVNHRLQQIVDDQKGSVRFEHDVFGNLAAAQYSDGSFEFRMPDAVGNLFRSQDRKDRRYGPAGQLLEAEGRRYDYDSEGNLIRKTDRSGGVWRYEWNEAGMLRRVARPDGDTVTFTYDALGRRISKQYREHTTRWVWDGNLPLHEWVEQALPRRDDPQAPSGLSATGGKAIKIRRRDDPPAVAFSAVAEAPEAEGLPLTVEAPSPAALTTWVFEPDSFAPLAKLGNGQRYGIVTDHLGTPVSMFSEQGEKIWDMGLSIYGEVRSLQGWREACPFRYPGQYEDVETGLYYNRFRYYDPEMGGYVSQDPIGLRGGMGIYLYVFDPNLWVDFIGLTGTYIFTDGTNTYIGKGPARRMNTSVAQRMGGSNVTKAHLDFGSNRMGLMVEAEMMRRNNFGSNPSLLNAINSPGERLLQSATQEELEQVGKNADMLEQAFKACP